MASLIVLNVTNCIPLSSSLNLFLPVIKIPYKSHRLCQSTWGTQVMTMEQPQMQREWSFRDMTRTLGGNDLSCCCPCHHLNTNFPASSVLKPSSCSPKATLRGAILFYYTSVFTEVPTGILWFSPIISSVSSNSILPSFQPHSFFLSNLIKLIEKY